MAKVKITGHASGSGVVTVTAPNTSTDRTITLPDATATIATTTDVAARLPSITDGGNATTMTIDASENVGIGVVPESTSIHSSYTSIDIARGGAIAGHSAGNGIKILGNSYRTASGYAYKNTEPASLYANDDGLHQFQVAPSGTADAAISWTTAMSIDNSGRVTKPLQPAFDAYHAGTAYSSGTTPTTLDLNTTRLNNGNHYNTSTDRFVAPVAGIYQFNYRTIIDGSHTSAQVKIFKNGAALTGASNHASGPAGWGNIWVCVTVSLAVNDYIQAIHAANTAIYGDSFQSFNGHLIG